MKPLPTELLDQIDLERLSPMMRQYVELKRRHPDCLLFFRLGDFYEMFFDDALIASRVLEIALTGRDCGQKERAPMCGVPYHAAEQYIPKLLSAQYKIAICEQLEDPSQAKGLVERGVRRIITPGTVTELESLQEDQHSYLLAVYQDRDYYGLAAIDVSTGLLQVSCIYRGAVQEKLYGELRRLDCRELLCNEGFAQSPLAQRFSQEQQVLLSVLPEEQFSPLAAQAELVSAVEAPDLPLWCQALAGLLSYLGQCLPDYPIQELRAQYYQVEQYMEMDASCRRHLELCQNLREGKRYASLLWVLDRCRSAMGQRLLRDWIQQPLLDLADIRLRQEAVSELKSAYILRQECRDYLDGIHDLARLGAKVQQGQANARDLLALQRSLQRIPTLKALLRACQSALLVSTQQELDGLEELSALLEAALDPQAGISLTEGGLIRPGYHAEIDELRSLAEGAGQWLLNYENQQKESTGIRNLKVGYNRVHGYYIEVSKSNLGAVPETYTRRQTLANAERFITEELKAMEDRILSSRQRLTQREYQLFCELREAAQCRSRQILNNAQLIAQLDCLASLAEVAERENYCQPSVEDSTELRIEQGRHPVVEKLLGSQNYVANDCFLDTEQRRLMVLTGPNMGGKSTYMRQVALIAVMAQIGSFVPAKSCRIGLVHKLFTRIGASDDLAAGDSTFMTEMREMAHILRHADQRSLLILDEVGRGTSTFDGLAIARAIIEAVADPRRLGCRTLFATHYHELTGLEEEQEGIFNMHVEVSRQGQQLHFRHLIAPGGADESYGIDVAALADIPADIVSRARDILRFLEEENQAQDAPRRRKIQQTMLGQQNLFTAEMQYNQSQKIIDDLAHLDIQSLDFMQALNRLYEFCQEARRLSQSQSPSGEA